MREYKGEEFSRGIGAPIFASPVSRTLEIQSASLIRELYIRAYKGIRLVPHTRKSPRARIHQKREKTSSAKMLPVQVICSDSICIKACFNCVTARLRVYVHKRAPAPVSAECGRVRIKGRLCRAER
jgi:hypothetical protein